MSFLSSLVQFIARPAVVLAILLCTASALDKVNIAVQVRTVGKTVDTDPGRADSQTRLLEITVTNRTRETLPDLVVKWTFFGEDLKEEDIVVAESGEEKARLQPGRSENLKTRETTFHYSRAGVQKRKGKGKRGGKAKKVPASGTRYAGWGVRVYQKGALVGEAYSLLELKEAL